MLKIHMSVSYDLFIKKRLYQCRQLLRGKPEKHSAETIQNISTQASEHLDLDYRVKSCILNF